MQEKVLENKKHGMRVLLLTLLGADFYSLATFEAHPEVFNQLTLIGEGLGSIYDTLCLTALGRDEHLFARNVSIKGKALSVLFSATHKE